jgi:hypothetical protein
MDLETRIGALEADMSIVKTDVAVIRSNYVTKDELAGVRATLAVISANYVTREDLAVVAGDIERIQVVLQNHYATKSDLKDAIDSLTWKIYGFGAALVAAVYFIARNVQA